ncbi:hint module-domain-containing protein [Pavlovales sp. CCMP2436]|nr:hint module-domain-containing protein [Pavlovales sp. CCMP2436]
MTLDSQCVTKGTGTVCEANACVQCRAASDCPTYTTIKTGGVSSSFYFTALYRTSQPDDPMCVANQCVFCVQDSDCAISKHPRDLFDKLLGRNPNNMLCDKRGGGVCVDCNTNRECPTNNLCVREQPDYTKCVYRVPFCFPADATVRTLRGSKRMDEVRVGDQVLVGGGVFSTVYMFVNRDPSKAISDFVRVDLANGGAVELTDSHLLRLGSGAYLAAGRVLPGMVVQVVTEESSSPELHTVTRTSIVRRAGLFAPMTLHGDIVVGGIVASSYSQVAASVLPAWVAAKVCLPICLPRC